MVTSSALDLSQQEHRRIIGLLGLLLPFLLYLLAGSLPTPPLSRWHILPSISAYYYTGAVAVFIGILFALALFLLTYRGYEGVAIDRWVGRIGGFAALGVAVFPTGAPEGLAEPPWWGPTFRVAHYTSATILFACFIVFALVLFRRSDVPPGQRRSLEKQRRDTLFLVCGIVMIGAVLWAGASLKTKAPIFWPEAIAIGAFAISWLVKGEAHTPVLRLLRRRATS